MLQRIQTVYLLIIAVLAALLLFMPLAVLQTGNDFYTFDIYGVKPIASSEIVYSTWGLFVLTALISLLALITIFLYKKRMLQIRLCIFNAILMLGFYGFFVYLIIVMKQQLDDVSISVRIALSFPVICLILDYLAIRNIGADETLVRSLERLR